MREPLPIDADLPRVVDALRAHPNLVLVAPPGAGKTTRVPVALLQASLLSRQHPNIVMLQPRRVAARAAASRIASENGWELGREVGYHVRFDRRIGRDTRLRVLTEGILTRQLLEDPFLEGVGAVLLDEFHERSLHTDLAIALLREVQQTVRDDLKLVVMSATLDAQPVARFLGDCPIVQTQGRTFPVDVRYHSTVRGQEEDAACDVVEKICAGGDARTTMGHNDVLIFLPGAEEIRRLLRRLEPLAARENLSLLPLHGSLTTEEQDAALGPDPQRRRKIIAATNIAETSLTIDGVGMVIDTGLARVAGYDVDRGLDKLEVQRISRASATQRAGRAGRTGPGVAVRLFSEKEWERMSEFEAPEIRRVDLASTVLELHAWGKSNPRAFGWYDPPDEPSLRQAEDLLQMLGATDASHQITPLGRLMAALPVHPRLARLLVSAHAAGLTREGATLAALIGEKDIVRAAQHDRASLTHGADRFIGDSDLIRRMEILESDARSDQLDRNAVKQVLRVREELIQHARRIGATAVADALDPEHALLQLALLAYPDRVCRRRGAADRGVMVGGGGVKLAAESVVQQAEFFVAVDARRDQRSATREALVRIASAVDPAWLERFFPAQVKRDQSVRFDDDRQRIVAHNRILYRDLLLREDKDAPVPPEQARDAFAQVLRQRGPQIIRDDESAASVLARIHLLREKMPEHPWPILDDSRLGELLAENAANARTLDQARALPLAQIIKSALPYPLDRMLDNEAPDALEVPSGSRIRLRYAGNDVVLAVRLQELFGMRDTPRIAGGRVAVKLELLAPNFRPVQVTTDLKSFWANTYFQVKKDLKARYPKHSWPDDPLTAPPQAKGRPRR